MVFTIYTKQASNNTATNFAFNFAVHALNALPPQGGTGTDAWGSFAGDGAVGPATVHASFNVDSINKTGAGRYTVTFVNNMPTADYAVNLNKNNSGTVYIPSKRTNGFDIASNNTSGNPVDVNNIDWQLNASNAQLPATITSDQIAALIQNPALSAWGDVASDSTLQGSFNVSRVSQTVKPDGSAVSKSNGVLLHNLCKCNADCRLRSFW